MGPCDVSLCVPCSDAHRSAVLLRCLRSFLDRPGGPVVDEVVVGLESSPTSDDLLRWRKEVEDLCTEKCVDLHWHTLGRILDFAAARNCLSVLASRPWQFHASADEVLVPPRDPALVESMLDLFGEIKPSLEGKLAPTIAATMVKARAEIECLWIPVDERIQPETGKSLRRRVVRRIYRGVPTGRWAWTRPAHEELRSVGDAPQEAAFGNLLLRHLPIGTPGSINGVVRRVSLLMGWDPDVAYWRAYSEMEASRYGMALEDAAEAANDTRSNLRLRVAAARLAFDASIASNNARRMITRGEGQDLLDDAASHMARLQAWSGENPETHRRELIFNHTARRWESAVDAFLAWRSTESRLGWGRIRYEDSPMARKVETFALGAEAALNCGKRDLALHALRQGIEGAGDDPMLTNLLKIAEAQQ